MKKLLTAAGLIIIVVFFSWRAIQQKQVTTEPGPDRPAGRPPVSVEVAEVRQAPIREAQQLTGAVYPSHQYIVAPRVPGRVIEIRKRIGDRIAVGEIVARIDDAEYQQAVIEADADLRIARASLAETEVQLERATQELERVRALEAKGIASLSELDKALAERDALKSRLKLSQANVEQRDASLATAKIKLGYTVLAAPEPGFVGERFVDEGSMLSSNSPIISVIGIDPAVVRTTVIERLYGRLRVGQVTEIEVDAYPDKRFSGTVIRIAPMFREDSRVAEMEIEVNNTSLFLKPGMFAKVRIVLSEKPAAQVVPTGAVITRNGDNAVFIVDEDQSKARYVPVEIGISTPLITEILSPELRGKVVTLGQHLLEDGSPVIYSGAGTQEGA